MCNLNVEHILAKMHADRDIACVWILYDIIEDPRITKDDISIEFNQTIANLVIGVN